MKPEKRLILILGDQLDLQGAALTDFDPHADEVVMIESISEAQYIWTHKAKIALFLSAMRHFAQALIDLGYSVRYIKASPPSISQTLKEQVLASNVQRVVCVEPGEWRLKQELEAMAQELKITLDIRVDDHFFCTQQEFREWVADKKELRLEYFYRFMRKKHGILIDPDGNPEGGQWNFDQDNRKPYPKKGPGMIDAPALFEPDAISNEVLQYVQETYVDHPGSIASFCWPVTRDQALAALDYLER